MIVGPDTDFGVQANPSGPSNVRKGAVGSVAWSISAGTLPPGVTLNAGSGFLSGTPTAAGGYSFTVQAVDQATATATANITAGGHLDTQGTARIALPAARAKHHGPEATPAEW